MKNLTSYFLAAAVLSGPALFAQAADDHASSGPQAEQTQDQHSAPDAPQASPMTSEDSDLGRAQSMNDEGSSADPMSHHGAAPSASKFIKRLSAEHLLAGDLIGYSVTNLKNENVGQVEDLILNKNQLPVGMILSVGGFMGFGAKHVALPMTDVQIDAENKIVRINFSKEELNEAPAFGEPKKEEPEGESEGSQSEQTPQSTEAE